MLHEISHNWIIFIMCCFLLFMLLLRQVDGYNDVLADIDCQCIPLKLCQNLNKQIARTRNRTEKIFLIEKRRCHFAGTDILVCCPKSDYIRYINNSFKNHKAYTIRNSLSDNIMYNCPSPLFGVELNYDDYVRKFHFNHSKRNDDIETDDNGKKFLPSTTYRTILIDANQKRTTNECGVLKDVFNNGTLYPWIARLAYLNSTKMTINYRCMGSLIDTNYILTAAHCVANLVQDLQLIYVRFGSDDNFQDYDIAEVIVHSNYNEPLFNNDVALLKLSSSIAYTSHDEFRKICLPENNLQPSAGISKGFVVSWNNAIKNRNRNVSTINYIDLYIINNTECAIRYARYSENFESSIIITPTEFCAQASTLKDVCEGDSGGPFMSLDKSNRYNIIGIVAFGPNTNCGQSNLPGVYTNVISHIDWIRRYITLN